ncbi:MAG: hypothetical protein EOO21_03945, partial [Comamonadaceae bacterium]
MTSIAFRALAASAALAFGACAFAADYTAPAQLSPPPGAVQKSHDAAVRAARNADRVARKAA